MFLTDLLQFVLDVQATTCEEAGGICPGTAFHAIAAAYATQGYWVQADLLDMLTFSNFSAVAPLIYVIAAIGGLVSVAMGQPPKTYMWFFLGPALFAWLIDTRQSVTGVQWQIAEQKQDQRQVWKLAEVGLLNTNLARRMEQWGYGHGISSNDAPSDVSVANFFLWYDSLLSGTINAMIGWAGPYTWQANDTANSSDTNAGNTQNLSPIDMENDKWFLLSNLKWGIMEDITSAKISSSELRDTLAEFMGGACGTTLGNSINKAAFAAAAHARGDNIPSSVFLRDGNYNGSENDMTELIYNLQSTPEVPFPQKLKSFLTENTEGSFRKAVEVSSDATWLFTNERETIRCDTYLLTLVLAFRWEAGHIMGQLVYKVPDLSPEQDADDGRDYAADKAKKLVYNLFYGWDIKIENGGTRTPLLEQQSQYFLTDLILLHLIRNEFALLQPADVASNGAWLSRQYVEEQQRQTGSKSKWGEIYAWALLMPHLQGVLLYYLAMGYPFACLLMLIPGWHKSLFTWMSFWAWVKLWDLGFALVMALERSVWATIGNGSATAKFHEKVVAMQDWGCISSNITCDQDSGAEVPLVHLISGNPGAGGGFGGFGGGPVCAMNGCPVPNDPYTLEAMRANFKIFDRALTLAPSLDLDLSNAYYIYIMAALYLAVPAVTGQLVLGAKSGAAGLIGTAIGGVAQEGGRAASAGYVQDVDRRVRANAAGVAQAAMAEGYGSLATSALTAGNKQAVEGMGGQMMDAMSRGTGYMQFANDARGRGTSLWGNAIGSQIGTAQRLNFWAQGSELGNSASNAVRQLPSLRTSDVSGGLPSPSTGGGKLSPYGMMEYGTRVICGTVDAGRFMYGPATAESAMNSTKMVDAGAQHIALAQGLGNNIAQAGYNVSSFDKSSMASGFGKGAQFASQGAQFAADTNRWNKMNAMANRMAGSLGAIGVSSTAFDPGPKPSGMEGMAYNGLLGGQAYAAARYFDNENSGFFALQKGAVSNLDGAVGKQAVSTNSSLPTYAQVYGAVDAHFQNSPGRPLGPNRDNLESVLDMGNLKSETTSGWMTALPTQPAPNGKLETNMNLGGQGKK